MITTHQQLLFFAIFVINIIIVSSSLTTVGNNKEDIFDHIKYCEKKQVTIEHDIKVLVKFCVIDEETALVHPVFVIQSLNNGQLKFNNLYKTWENQLKVEFFPKEVLKKVKQLPYHTHRKFEYLKIDSVRFVMQKLQQIPKDMKPSFILSPKSWKVVTEHETSAILSLYSSNKQSDSFAMLSRSDVISAVKVEYQVKVKDNKISSFKGNLVIVKEIEHKISIQRRVDGTVSFARNWNEYVNGFGDSDGSFWIGLERMHQLTKGGNYKIRFEMKTYRNDTLWYATYDTFKVGSATDYYRLTVGEFNRGKSNFDGEKNGDGMMYNNNMQFSTMDQDHDTRGVSCSTYFGSNGGWWFKTCAYVHGNGLWRDRRESGHSKYIHWYSLDEFNSLKYFHMMLIPK